ncbi:tRNA(Ile)-lysidine synthase [Haloferula luteola]|uniref:tRNA(Ile)-lysidine synthase n=1 Tax=Haloferula luteola TaxID=595692 RepID=A0A840V3A1_9BACT|nr:tRNA lysidine(34) synthetase TilS [Haloferula luteola]MBB5352777.1 tRNA(Ile)-lysidine synthase [Haloferula luteola]
MDMGRAGLGVEEEDAGLSWERELSEVEWMLVGSSWFKKARKDLRYLVGVSGGADSVALLHGLKEAGFEDLVVCHLDHGLRGQESVGDREFVEALAHALGCAFEEGRWDGAKWKGREGSMETVAREARRQFFEECAIRWEAPRVILGHHADDQAETALWHLLRGSRGVSAMKEVQIWEVGGGTLEWIRPLLGCRRAELRAWLRSRGLIWREDGTNGEPIAVRNRLRNELLPLAESIIRRDPVEALCRALRGDEELREIEAWAVEQAGAVDPQGRLHAGRLRCLPPALRGACVYRYLVARGLSGVDRAVVGRVVGMLEEKGASRVPLPGGRMMRRKEGRLWVE